MSNLILIVLGLVVLTGLTFYVGMRWQEHKCYVGRMETQLRGYASLMQGAQGAFRVPDTDSGARYDPTSNNGRGGYL